MKNRARDRHALLSERRLRCGGDFLQNTLILVATNAELNQGIPLVLRQEVPVHRLDYFVDGALSEEISSAHVSRQ